MLLKFCGRLCESFRADAIQKNYDDKFGWRSPQKVFEIVAPHYFSTFARPFSFVLSFWLSYCAVKYSNGVQKDRVISR